MNETGSQPRREQANPAGTQPAGPQPGREQANPAGTQPVGPQPAGGQRYLKPKRNDRVFNRLVATLTRSGVSIWGSRILAVRGRVSGEWRTTPVNPLTIGGERYLVAPRGHTQWVRNLRAAGGGELRVGRRAERFTATELADADKPAVLRAYLRKWKWEVGMFFQGVGPDAPDSKLAEIAPEYPVFRISVAR